MGVNIAGLIVVRLPALNYLVRGQGRIPVLDGLYYSGVDRQRWIDVFDEDYYAKRIPDGATRFADQVRTRPADFTGIDLCQDDAIAAELLKYSNRSAESNELIALRSSQLESVKGKMQTNFPIEWIGFDFVAVGEWSLIAAGVFLDPNYYSGWRYKLNKFGLFSDSTLLAKYTAAYEEAVRNGNSEPASSPTDTFTAMAVEVGRISHPRLEGHSERSD